MPEDRKFDQSDTSFNRRQLMTKGMGGVALGGTAAMLSPISALGAEGEDPSPAVNGTLTAASQDELFLEDYHLSLAWPYSEAAPSGEQASVRVSDDTEYYRDGPGRSLSDFQVGDRLIAYVSVESGELLASSVEPVYTGISARVISRAGDALETSSGSVLLTDATLYHRASDGASPTALGDLPAAARAAAFASGDQIGATCRVEPGSASYIAAQIVVE